MDEEQLAKGAEKVANYLAKNAQPQSWEEAFLKELWKVRTEEEQTN